jgi:prepilin-type N-terminal cleavage/methylation domain-containing protein
MRNGMRGFSLIEVIIAVGAMAVLALGIGSMLKTGFMGQKTLQAQDDARVLTSNMANILLRPAACKNTFGGLNPASAGGGVLTEIKDDKSPVPNVHFRTYPPDNRYGNRGVQLVGLTIGGTVPELDRKTNIKRWDPEATPSGLTNRGTAFVRVDWRQTGSGNTGPEILQRYFMVYVTNVDASGNITDCTATLGGGTGGGDGGTAPPGFVAIGEEGQLGRFFIQETANAPAHYWAASKVCALIPTAVAHLCTSTEWYTACERAASSGIAGMPGTWEWTADFVGDFNNGDAQDTAMSGGTNGRFPTAVCHGVQRNGGGIYDTSESRPFRCCIDP